MGGVRLPLAGLTAVPSDPGRVGGPGQQQQIIIGRIVFSCSRGDHDAWRGRPGTARFSRW
jgi:hypothetical protein